MTGGNRCRACIAELGLSTSTVLSERSPAGEQPCVDEGDEGSFPAQPRIVSFVEPATAVAYDERPVIILGLGSGFTKSDLFLSCIRPVPRVGGGLFLDICAKDTLAFDAPDNGFGRNGLKLVKFA